MNFVPDWQPTLGVHVWQVAMAAPDVVHLIIHDEDIVRYPIVALGSPDPAGRGAVVDRVNPATGLPAKAVVVGINADHLRFSPRLPTQFINYANAVNPANYAAIGARTVTAVRFMTIPEDNDILQTAAGGQNNWSSMAHHVYLQLSGNLADGSYTVTNTAGAFPAVALVVKDKETRCSAIHATHIGHRAAETDKAAYLSLWLPGGPNNGDVDFAAAYGVTSFHVIDSLRRIRFTGTAQLRTTPATVETKSPSFEYPTAMASGIKSVEAMVAGNPTQLKITGHGYSSGQRKFTYGFSTANNHVLEGTYHTVTVIDADWFSVPVTTSGSFNPSLFTAETNGKVHDVYTSNRAATHVYYLDYSAFVPAEDYGDYQIYIPGLGVSWPFPINEGVYIEATKMVVRAYYLQCWGIPKVASVGGYNFPASLRDGVNGCEIYESLMPSMLESENQQFSDANQFTTGDDAPWITGTRVTGWFGGYADAGDWDMQNTAHFGPNVSFLHFAYTLIPSAVRNIDLGFPKLSSLYGEYTAIYNEIDDLGSVVHMVLYYIEPFRKFQNPTDGRVYSGMQFSGVNATGGGDSFEPSWMTGKIPHLNAADHPGNFAYAAAAAHAAMVLKDAGKTALAATYYNSALAAYNWAEAIYQDYAANGIAGTTWGAYYLTTLGIQTKTGWSNGTLTTVFNQCEAVLQPLRRICHVAFHVYTNGAAPWDGFIATYNAAQWSNMGTAHDIWLATPGGAGSNTYATSAWDLNYTHMLALGESSYRHLNPSNYFNIWGVPSDVLRPFNHTSVVADKLTADSKYIKLLHAGRNYLLGANQQNLCNINGLGRENAMVLHMDRLAAGYHYTDWPGYVPYLWSYKNDPGFSVLNYGVDNSTNFTATRSQLADEANNGSKKLIRPYWSSVPAHQSHHKNTGLIFKTEFVTELHLVAMITILLYSHLWDGNTETQTAWPKRFLAKAA